MPRQLLRLRYGCGVLRLWAFLCVSLCVCPLAYDTFKLHDMFCTCYPWPWLGPLTAMHTLCTSACVRDVMFVHNGPYGAWIRRRIIKVTHQGAAQGTTSWRLHDCLVTKYCGMSLCVSVCPRGYLRDHTRDLYRFCACCLCPWLGPPPARWR